MICGERIPNRGTSQSYKKKFEVLKVQKESSVAKGIKISKERIVENKVKCVDHGG